MTTPPFGYFGSKVKIARQIVALMPEHSGYIEPFAGSLSVLLAKPAVGLEVVNDLDGDLMTFWRMLRDQPEELVRICSLTPHSRSEYDASWPIPSDVPDLERARRVWVKLSQGRSGVLRRTGWRYNEAPRGRTTMMPGTIRGYVDRMVTVADRLRDVSLECRPALEIISRYGRVPDNLLYIDPPYLGSVRTWGNNYAVEMRSDDEHRALADALADCSATVVLSGYPSDLYDQLFTGWHRAEIQAGTSQNNNAGWQSRTEVLWSNRPFAVEHPRLFTEVTA